MYGVRSELKNAVASGMERRVFIVLKQKEWKDPVHYGYLRKLVKNGLINSWKKKFYVLRWDGKLYSFEFEKSMYKAKNIKCEHVEGRKFWEVKRKETLCLQIERYPKPIILHGSSDEDTLEWKKKLIEAGCRFCQFCLPEAANTSPKTTITKKKLGSWSHSNVQQWFSLISKRIVGKDSNETIAILSQIITHTKMKGKTLKTVTVEYLDKQIRALRPRFPDNWKRHRSRIISEIFDVQRHGRFHHGEYVVQKKMQRMLSDCLPEIEKEESPTQVISKPNFFVRALTDPTLMMETYLRPKMTRKDFRDCFAGGIEIMKPDIVFDGDELTDYTLHTDEHLPTRFWITEAKFCEKDTPIRRILKPILGQLGFPEELGNLKVVLEIGTLLFEWNEYGLCIPKRLPASSSLLPRGEMKRPVEPSTNLQRLKDIAKIICRCNTSVTSETGFDFLVCKKNMLQKVHFYDRLQNPSHSFSDFSKKYQKFLIVIHWTFSKTNISKDVLEHSIIPFISEKSILDDPYWKNWSETGGTDDLEVMNCFDFVGTVLRSRFLNRVFTRDSCGGKKLWEELRKQGVGEMVFCPSENFRNRFKLENWKEFEFETHLELDCFVRRLIEIDDEVLNTVYWTERRLLKSFDRMFWFRHYSKPEEEKYKPYELGCPFDGPDGRSVAAESESTKPGWVYEAPSFAIIGDGD